jgi:hypothetical protein
MLEGVTVLIGPKVLAASLEQHPDARGTELLVFAEERVCEAIEHIVLRRPRIVALSEKFALSPRGTAVAHRVAIDPQLAGIQVLMIGTDGSVAPVPPEGRPTWLPVDAFGTRRVPRIRMRRGIDVQIDGATAALVDLSTMGAQVVSPTVLKPSQRVRLTLPVDSSTIRAEGTVAWASFEVPKGKSQPQYRAGLEFSVADPEPLLQFCLAEADGPSAS